MFAGMQVCLGHRPGAWPKAEPQFELLVYSQSHQGLWLCTLLRQLIFLTTLLSNIQFC